MKKNEHIKDKLKLDKKDFALLNELVLDSGQSLRQIGDKINVSPTTVMNKEKSFFDHGIIKRKTVELNYDKLGYDLTVIISIRVAKGKLGEVEKKIAKNNHVYGVYDVTGDFDVEVLARFQTRRHLDQFIKSVQKIEYVERTNTRLVLNIIKEGPMFIR